MGLRIVAMSDTHGMHEQVQVPAEANVIVHAGDMTGHGSLPEFIAFLDWFAAQPHQYKLCVPGNHDACVEKHTVACKTEAEVRGIKLLVNDQVEVEGVRFYGSPTTPLFCDWSFMKRRGSEIASVWKSIPKNVDVLVTHGPAYGHGDQAPPYRGSNPRHVGCLELLQRLRIVTPQLHIFGHIHGGYGVTNSDELPSTTFVNASICTEAYKPTNHCQVVSLLRSQKTG